MLFYTSEIKQTVCFCCSRTENMKTGDVMIDTLQQLQNGCQPLSSIYLYNMLDCINIPGCESISDRLSRIGDTSISRSTLTALA